MRLMLIAGVLVFSGCAAASLASEESAIRAEFPELFGRGRRGAVAESVKAVGRRRRKKKMSPAARKAVSERMRKYWAERRKSKGK